MYDFVLQITADFVVWLEQKATDKKKQWHVTEVNKFSHFASPGMSGYHQHYTHPFQNIYPGLPFHTFSVLEKSLYLLQTAKMHFYLL